MAIIFRGIATGVINFLLILFLSWQLQRFMMMRQTTTLTDRIEKTGKRPLDQ